MRRIIGRTAAGSTAGAEKEPTLSVWLRMSAPSAFIFSGPTSKSRDLGLTASFALLLRLGFELLIIPRERNILQLVGDNKVIK